MSLSQFCTDSNLAWESAYGCAYHYTREDGKIRTVFKYQIPFSPEKESIFTKAWKVPRNARMDFYKNLVRCIQRQVNIAKYLADSQVNSILTYSAAEQDRSEDGITSIYLETEQVWPILEHLLVGAVPALTVLDVVSRLAVILRDISKEQVGVIHRGLDLNEVYISADNKILLGGFFYAACPKLGSYPDFLPGRLNNIPTVVQQGGPGAHKTDIQSLSIIAWNLFSGLPFDSVWNSNRRTAPEFSFHELNAALLLGMAGEDEVCNLFRRRLSECRKLLNRAEAPQAMVPIRKSLETVLRSDWVDAV